MKVLVAEDEALIRLDVCAVLEASGFEVCEARDGEEAVRFASEETPDAAFIDVGMPGLDGIEATRQILASREIPVVLLTAHADPSVVDRAIDAGVSGYLVKPFGERALVPALKTAIERHRELVAVRPRRPRSRAAPRARRGEVLDAAARIFADKGFAETTIQDIADAVGVLKGSLYYYFSSKEQLLHDVLTRADDSAWARVEEAVTAAAPAIEQLRAWVVAQLEATADDPAGMALLFQEPARRSRYEGIVAELLVAGARDGSIRTGVDATLAAGALVQAARGAPDIAAAATSLIIGGLRSH
jgi:response regulator NasT